MPNNWVWTTIENICSKIGSGSTPKGSNYSSDGIIFFRSQNVHNDGIVLDDIKYISKEIHKSMIGTEVLPNDLLLNITGGSLGRCTIVPNMIDRGNVSQHVCILRPILVKAEYLHIFILSSFFAKTMKITGSGREGLPKYNLEKMFLPLPPLEEQKGIMMEIERWFALIDQIEQGKSDLQTVVNQAKNKILDLAIHGKLIPQDPNDEPASELFKRINPKAEITCDNRHSRKLPQNWCICRLKDLCSFLSRGKSPKYSENDKTYPVFAQKCNLKEGGISLKQARFLAPSTICKWSEVYKLRTGDILVNSTGTGTVGRTRLFNESCLGQYSFVVPDSHVSVIRTLKEIESKFVYAYISSQLVQQYLADNLAGSTNQKELYIGVLENLRILLPPLNEQRRIVQKIEELFSALDNIQKALEV